MLTSASAFLERIKSESPVMEKPVRRIAVLAMLGAFSAWSQTSPPVIDPTSQTAIIDSLADNLDDMDALMRKSMLSGSSKPVSFSGEALARFVGTSYDVNPYWMGPDQDQTKNTVASIRVAMVAAPQRNLRLWSKIAFNAAFMGTNRPASLADNVETNATNHGDQSLTQSMQNAGTAATGTYATPQTGYFSPHSNTLYEDMCAGLIASIGKASTSIKLGGVLWTETSPLTVWKGQNRMFGWDYLPYALEQDPAQYYEYATSKGELSGRAAWNKKPFEGIQWQSVDLPGKLYFELTYGYYEGYQAWQPYFINPANSNGLLYTTANDHGGPGLMTFAGKGLGTGDSYHPIFNGRLAREEIPLPGGQALPIQVGLNYVNYHTNSDYAKQYAFTDSPDPYAEGWNGLSAGDANAVNAWGIRRDANGMGFDTSFKSNYTISYQTVSVDFRQTVQGKVNFLVDIGASQVDTAFFKAPGARMNGAKTVAVTPSASWYHGVADSVTIANAPNYSTIGHTYSPVVPAIYAQASNLISGTIGSSFPIDLGFQSIYAPKQFYSATSFITPQDAFFPFEANLTGPGKFAGADNGTPYVSNEVGANFTIKYTGITNGHLRMNVGYHSQIENGSDLLWIPWRLNGTAYDESQYQSTTQYGGMGLTDDYLRDNPDIPNPNKQGNTGYYGMNTPGTARQLRRMANDFYFYPNPGGNAQDLVGDLRKNPYGYTPGLVGGTRNDFMSTFEAAGMFRLRQGALYAQDTAAIHLMINDGDMPQSRKATQNLSLDYAKDISGLWKGKNPLFLAFYGAANGVSTGGLALPSSDQTYLSGYLLRFQPVYQLTQKFWLVGLLGQEQWYSRYGVAVINASTGYAPNTDSAYANPANWHAAPIDYLDRTYGVGFDWAMTSRVELHTRVEYFTHVDRGISVDVPAAAGHNDYQAWLLHAETKMWF
jgi:hypothetical protein